MESYETVIIILIITLGSVLGWLFTESSECNIPKHIPQLDRKPFNCRPCLTFHIIWIISGIAAFSIESLRLFIAGISLALLIFIAFYLVNKIQIDD